jgi:CRISPR-associated exonuclease Cas4
MPELPDYLPLSYLNQLIYCPRRFWLMFYQSEIEFNAPMLEGALLHQRAHRPGEEKDENGRIIRSVHVWSDPLHIAGVADFVEEHDGVLVPVEYKRGRMGQWINDHVQLCAQAMCLEERTGTRVPTGEIFYWTSRRRERVELDAVLREHTRAVIAQAFDLLADGRIPPPIDHAAKCRDCSMEPICLPREMLQLMKEERV